MSTTWGMHLKPEERREGARAQMRESARILGALAERSDVSAEAFEFELRMQALWLVNAANQWHEAEKECALIQKARELYLKREGAMQ